MTIEGRIEAIADSLQRLVSRLADRRYQFARPSAVLPGPENGTDEAIERMEREVGRLPLALTLFWRQVGSVDLCGSHSEWEGCRYPDPLVVFPPSMALIELETYLADPEDCLDPGCPFRVPIAPDDRQKAGVGGGMWYSIAIPADADDPPLDALRHETTFLGYLEFAIRWGGFPGLSRSGVHSWPIAELRERETGRI